jgi:hypothetical protein
MMENQSVFWDVRTEFLDTIHENFVLQGVSLTYNGKYKLPTVRIKEKHVDKLLKNN